MPFLVAVRSKPRRKFHSAFVSNDYPRRNRKLSLPTFYIISYRFSGILKADVLVTIPHPPASRAPCKVVFFAVLTQPSPASVFPVQPFQLHLRRQRYGPLVHPSCSEIRCQRFNTSPQTPDFLRSSFHSSTCLFVYCFEYLIPD